MAVVEGDRYLVSMLGSEAAWVRNVKAAAGRAVLRHGRIEQVRLEEIPPEKRPPVLKAYLQCAPGARPHVAVDKDAPLEHFEAIAAQIPVFRILPAGQPLGDESSAANESQRRAGGGLMPPCEPLRCCCRPGR